MSIFPSLPAWLVDATLRGSVLIVCIWFLRPLVRRWMGARATHLLWMAVLVHLLVPWLPRSPFSLESYWAGSRPSTSPAVENVQISVKVGEAPAHPAQARLTATPPALRSPAYPVIIWTLGIVVVGGLSLVRAVRAASLVRRAPEIEDIERFSAVLADMPELPGRLRICETKELRSPALCGIVRPTILLPEGWTERFSPEELRCVLWHEIGHFRRGDLVWHWAFLIARAIHWFNPLVWLAERSARADQEMACDEWVVSHSTCLDERAYGEALLKVAGMLSTPRLVSPLHATMAESKAGLTQRIHHLARIRPHGWSAIATALVLAACLLIFLAPSRIRAESEAKSPPSSVIMTGKIEDASPAKPVNAVRNSGDRVIEIEAKFVEISGGDPNGENKERSTLPIEILGNSFGEGANASRLNSVLKEEAYNRVISALNKKSGVDFLSAPRVVAKPGQNATIEIIREFRYPTEFEQANAASGHLMRPKTFETKNTGLTLKIETEVLSDGRIELVLTPEVVEFMGFVNYRADPPSRPADGGDALAALLKPAQMDPSSASPVLNQPVFEMRKLSTCIVLESGQTALVGGITRTDEQVVGVDEGGWYEGGNARPDGRLVGAGERMPLVERMTRFLGMSPRTQKIERSLYIFVTARLIDAKEAAMRAVPNPKKAARNATASEKTSGAVLVPSQANIPNEKLPAAILVAGKPGYYRSPHAPEAGYVDLRGFPPGTEIKCPYTGKMFRLE